MFTFTQAFSTQIVLSREKNLHDLRFADTISYNNNYSKDSQNGRYIHCVSEKVPTIKLSVTVTLSNLKRFFNFLLLDSL